MISSEPTKSQRQERRQHTRTKVAVEAELNLEGGRTPPRVKTADLSLGGLYVEMMLTLEIGSKLKIVLWMAGAPVSTAGVVVTRDLQVGNGIKFTEMTPEDRAKLKHFLTAAQEARPPR